MGLVGADLDHVLNAAGARVHFEHNAAVLAHAVQLSLWTPPQSVRCEIWVGAEVAGVPPSPKIEQSNQMAGVRILTVDSIAVDRNVGGPMVGRYRQLVNTRRKGVKRERGCVCLGV